MKRADGAGNAPFVTLYRPVGPAELKLIEASAWTRFPPRLPDQPIFYPVLTLEYADQITRQWNVPQQGAGFVTEFDVDAAYAARFEVKQVGGREHTELWVPADELETFNSHIRGTIRLVRAYPAKDPAEAADFTAKYTPPDEAFIAFASNGSQGPALVDSNMHFRNAVCDHFRQHKSATPLPLVAALYTAETQFAQAAWGVQRIVSELAQELVERGGTEYAEVYFAGMTRGMDAYLESGRIALSRKRRDELVAYCAAQRQTLAGTMRAEHYDFFGQRMAGIRCID